jgi:hypothetical protein
VRLEGLGQLKKKIQLIGTGTRDLQAFSVVSQPTTLTRALFYPSVEDSNLLLKIQIILLQI